MRRAGCFCVGADRCVLVGVEAQDVGKHHAYGLAVGDAEVGGERVGCGMGRAEHAILDGHAGHRPQDVQAKTS